MKNVEIMLKLQTGRPPLLRAVQGDPWCSQRLQPFIAQTNHCSLRHTRSCQPQCDLNCNCDLLTAQLGGMDTRRSSSSYSSVAPAGMLPCFAGTCSVGRNVKPLSPNPNSGGTTTFLLPPAFMVEMASSVPAQRPPVNGRPRKRYTIGLPRARVSSNTSPLALPGEHGCISFAKNRKTYVIRTHLSSDCCSRLMAPMSSLALTYVVHYHKVALGRRLSASYPQICVPQARGGHHLDATIPQFFRGLHFFVVLNPASARCTCIHSIKTTSSTVRIIRVF